MATFRGVTKITFSDTTMQVIADTSDASDSKCLQLAGGGAANDNTRGAFANLFGNEHASAGSLVLSTGNNNSALLELRAAGSSSAVKIYINGTNKWNFGSGGEFAPQTNNNVNFGTTSLHTQNMYTYAVGTGDSTSLNFIIANATKWSINTSGNLVSATDNTYDIGTTSNQVKVAYSRKVSAGANGLTFETTSTNDMTFSTNSTSRWTIGGSAGALAPITTNTYDIGALTARVNVGFYKNLNLTNNQYIQWRNAADDSSFSILRVDSSNATEINSANSILFKENSTTRWSILSGGNLQYTGSDTHIFANTSDGSDNHNIQIGGGGAISSTRGAYIRIFGNEYSTGEGLLDLSAGNTTSGNSMISLSAPGSNGTIAFLTNGNTRWRVTNSGHFLPNADDGVNLGGDSNRVSLITASSYKALLNGNTTQHTVQNNSGSFTGTQYNATIATTAGTGFKYFQLTSNSNPVWNVQGNGATNSDNAYSSGGGDYAEYFETLDETALELGIVVVMDENNAGFIRAATENDSTNSIFGVVRPKGDVSSVIGNLPMNWSQKYLRDIFGGYILDQNGERQINPEYDENESYTSRKDRPEWQLIGLVGQVVIEKTQPKHPSWLKMKDLDENYELWLIR